MVLQNTGILSHYYLGSQHRRLRLKYRHICSMSLCKFHMPNSIIHKLLQSHQNISTLLPIILNFIKKITLKIWAIFKDLTPNKIKKILQQMTLLLFLPLKYIWLACWYCYIHTTEEVVSNCMMFIQNFMKIN